MAIINIAGLTAKLSESLTKHAPEILIGAGITVGVGATVTACAATKHLEERKQDAKNIIEEVHKNREDAEARAAAERTFVQTFYPDMAYKRDLAFAFLKAGIKICAPYAPSAVLTLAGMCLTLKGTGIYRADIYSLKAAYAEVVGLYAAYRANVQNKYGPEVDQQMRFGGTLKKLTTLSEQPDGTVQETSEKVRIVDDIPSLQHDHDVILSKETCSYDWETTPGYNAYYLTEAVDRANGELATRVNVDVETGIESPGIMSIYECYTHYVNYDYSDVHGKERTRRIENDMEWGWILAGKNDELKETKISMFPQKITENGKDGMLPNQKKFLTGGQNLQVLLTPQNIVHIPTALKKYGYV